MNNKKKLQLGDRHNGAYTALVTDGENKYIQKPRNAQTEYVWALFLDGIKKLGFDILPATVKVLSETENSHTEEVVEHIKTDGDGLKRYYRRLGSLIFWAYSFGSTDLHAENLIASGEYPVLVDLETLFSALPKRNKEAEAGVYKDVFRSHFLPVFDEKNDLCGSCGDVADGLNLPYTENGTADIAEYLEYLKDGFDKAYDFTLAHKAEVKKLIDNFSVCSFRFLLRPTKTYFYILEKLKKSADKKLSAEEMLSRAYKKDVDPEWVNKASEVLQNEITDILNGDVPLFYLKGDGTGLYCKGKEVMKDYLKSSPVSFAKERLERLCVDDKLNQLKLLDIAFASKRKTQEKPKYSGNIFEKIISELERCYVASEPTRFVVLDSQRGNVSFYKSCDWGLYSGLSGIMCAYAAIYAKTESKKALARENEYLDIIENTLVNVDFCTPLNDYSLSLSDGIGGIVSCLLHIYELTGLERAYNDAVQLVKKIDVNRVNINKADVLTGFAGICSSLTKLPKEISRPIAGAVFPKLLEANVTLTGAAHGMAGIATSLGAVQRVLNTNEADSKIIELINAENVHFDKIHMNWKDLRNPQKIGYMNGWCAGAPGIGMCRKKLSEYSENKEIIKLCEDDIKKVKLYLTNTFESKRATLCCGEASRVMAASALGVKIENYLDNSVYADAPRLFHALETSDLNPGLMQGLAGVGYALAMKDDERSGGMLL